MSAQKSKSVQMNAHLTVLYLSKLVISRFLYLQTLKYKGDFEPNSQLKKR